MLIFIEIKKHIWNKTEEMHISRSFFFERRVFDDIYDKQGDYNVKIDVSNLFINSVNIGRYIMEYSFIDTQNIELNINGETIKITKKAEGLNINTLDSEFYILNRNFYENILKMDSS